MFWLGVIAGLIVGGCAGVFFMALCVASRDDIENNNTK